MNPILLVVGALIGVACFKEAAKFERAHGKAPWGGSPAMWGVVGFLFGLIGALVLFIAERGTKKRLAAAPPSWSSFDNRFAAPPPPQQQWAPPPSQSTPPPGGWPAPPVAPSSGNIGGTDFLPRR